MYSKQTICATAAIESRVLSSAIFSHGHIKYIAYVYNTKDNGSARRLFTLRCGAGSGVNATLGL